jgi:anaerobic ribonucleoside-triphosphate reductase activating protein
MSEFLNVGIISESTQNLGPGKRFVIWVQGCNFNCINCESPELRPIINANRIDIEKLADVVIETANIYGITISGGEPFLQAKTLYNLLSLIRLKRPDLNVVIYSGYENTELIWNDAKELMSLCDVAITGRYIDELNDNKGLRGSSNQEVIFLTERLRPYEHFFNNATRSLEFEFRENETIMIGLRNRNCQIN